MNAPILIHSIVRQVTVLIARLETAGGTMFHVRARGWRFVWVGLVLLACGGALGKPTAGGESHFLRGCNGGCGAGLECIVGSCTRACTSRADSCTDLAADASCSLPNVDLGLAVCDVACRAGADCAALGDGFVCADGFCRGPLLPGQALGVVVASPNVDARCTDEASCGSHATCIDSAGHTCDPSTQSDCTGVCRGTDGPAICSGLGMNSGCSAGFSCREPDHEPNVDVSGLCYRDDLLAMCALDPTACPEGFGLPAEANCWAEVSCQVAAPQCPDGYAPSRSGVQAGQADCYGECVPVERCVCTGDEQCPDSSVCSTLSQRCAQLWTPPDSCSLPPDAGACQGGTGTTFFAAVNGRCVQETDVGCPVNDNHFRTLEECMSVCEGRPGPNLCPRGRTSHTTCLSCGEAGGCRAMIQICAEPCETSESCGPGLLCDGGFCSPTGPCP